VYTHELTDCLTDYNNLMIWQFIVLFINLLNSWEWHSRWFMKHFSRGDWC